MRLRVFPWRQRKNLIFRTAKYKRAKDELRESEARYRTVVVLGLAACSAYAIA